MLVELGVRAKDGPVLLRDIAKSQEISEKYLSLIIIPLKAAGLVTAYRGVHGGYALRLPPAEISLRTVVEALEGKIDLIDCIGNPSGCGRAPVCVTRDIWKELGERISGYLESVTIEEIIKRGGLKAAAVPSYQI